MTEVFIAAACFLTAFLLFAAIGWLELIPWRKAEGRLWPDRARILLPARTTQGILLLYLPLLLVGGASLLWEASLAGHLLRWLAAFTGATAAGWFFTRQLFPGIRLRQWVHEVAGAWVLRLGIWAILAAIAMSMPYHFNLRTWLTLAGAAILLVLWFTFSIHLLRLLRILTPPDARLKKIVASCIQAGGPRVKNLWQARMVAANAFAMPLTGTLLFSDSLLENLTDEEIAAVCSHELGHLAESGKIVFLRYLGAMSVLPYLLVKPVHHLAEMPGVIALLLLPVLWTRLSARLAHRMELLADASARPRQASEGVYASALEKIYRYNHFPAVMPGKTTHPHLYDRMLASGVTPDFPRPLVPEKFTPLGWFLIFAAPMILMGIYLFHEG